MDDDEEEAGETKKSGGKESGAYCRNPEMRARMTTTRMAG